MVMIALQTLAKMVERAKIRNMITPAIAFQDGKEKTVKIWVVKENHVKMVELALIQQMVIIVNASQDGKGKTVIKVYFNYFP